MIDWKAGAGAPQQPYIMQLGAILQDLDTRKVLQEINLLVKLPDGVVPSPEAVAVHKITPEMCAQYGYRSETVFRMFEVMLSKAELVVAHNLRFDALMWEIECLRHTFVNMDSFRRARPFCTMLTSTTMCKVPQKNGRGGYKWPTLQEANAYFFPDEPWDEEGAHDAMYDVRKCQAIYWKIHDRLNSL